MDAEFKARMQVLLDKQDIYDVLARYCRGVDRADRDLIASCYHPGAIDDHGGWIASAPEVADKIVAAIRGTQNAVTHFAGTTLIEVEGDVAYVESYFQATHDLERDGKRYLRCRAGRYIDRFERRNGDWKIAERSVFDDWNHVDLLVESQPGSDKFRYGRKDAKDAIYAIKRGRVARPLDTVI